MACRVTQAGAEVNQRNFYVNEKRREKSEKADNFVGLICDLFDRVNFPGNAKKGFRPLDLSDEVKRLRPDLHCCRLPLAEPEHRCEQNESEAQV